MRRFTILFASASFFYGLIANQAGCVGDNTVINDASVDQTTSDTGAPDTFVGDTGTLDSGDAGDAASGQCTLTKPFGTPAAISALNVFADQQEARLAHDALSVYFTAGGELEVATRNTILIPFGVPTALLSDAGTTYMTSAPTVTPDALTLYAGSTQISFATRATPNGKFGGLSPVTTLNNPSNTGQPFVQGPTDLWFVSHTDVDGSAGAGGTDIYHATITGQGTTSNVLHPAELATVNNEYQPTVTQDGLTIYFARNADVNDGGATGSIFYIYTATRTSTSLPFSNIVPVTELNVLGASQRPSWISGNGCVLWFESSVASDAGAYEIYTATKAL